ncbi:MAG: SDR family oxidoreductase [Elainellaceae cyanobacterium]
MTDLVNRRALITGASSGIGKATALTLAKAGFHLVLLGRSQEKLDAVVAEARPCDVDIRTYCVDLAQVDQVKSTIEKILKDCDGIDVLINNAGIGYTGTLAETPLKDWIYTLNLNLTSVFQCIQAVLPTMRDRHGMIINIASIAAQTPFPGWGAYSVSKAGLVALSKTLAGEERANGVRVVTISPGAVNTPIWDTETVDADFDRSQMLTPDVIANAVLHAVLMPPYAVVEEMTVTPSAGAL